MIRLPSLVHSVRWRLQLWHALILLVVIAALCMLAFRLALDDRRERISRELESFERKFMRAFWDMSTRDRPKDKPLSTSELRDQFRSLDDPSRFPLELRDLFDSNATESTYLAYWDGDGRLWYKSANAPASLGFPPMPPPDREKTERLRGTFHEIISGGPRGSRSIVGRNISADRAELRRLGLQITASGALLWLLGLLGGWWLAGRVIQPIEAISQTASRIAGGKLSERIDIAGTDDELTRLSQVLNDTFDRLATAIERQREFTADASHELRTPLTVILSETSRGLKRDRPAEEYREILSTCGLAATRMRALVESLLLLARQDAAPGAELRPIDLAAVVGEAVLLHQPLAANHSIRLEADLHPATCLADANAVAIIAGNLISNAILHQPPGGRAMVRVTAADETAILEVIDHGPGIPKEHLPRLFDRFYRVDPARGPSSGHSGLGLSIVRAIVENHHGTVEVDSEPGRGSTFRVTLPIAG